MFGLGMGELLVILAVALLVLGPKRLPEMASGLGKAIRDFRRATQDIQSQLEIDETVGKPLAELRSALSDHVVPSVRPSVVAPPAHPVVAVQAADSTVTAPAAPTAAAAADGSTPTTKA